MRQELGSDASLLPPKPSYPELQDLGGLTKGFATGIKSLLAEQGRHARAIEVYLEDLELFPRNPWALAGLKRCYAATADARLAETAAALEAALRDADVEIHASCACALSHWGPCCD